jgi:hypothetical protein
MGLTGVLVDRARVLRRAPTQVKVEGRTIVAPYVRGAWFRIRVDMKEDRKSREPSDGPNRTVRSPVFMCGVRDLEGRPLDIIATDRLEVVTVGTTSPVVYELTGDPSPIRKKRATIGYEGSLRRVDEHPMDPSGGQAGRTG